MGSLSRWRSPPEARWYGLRWRERSGCRNDNYSALAPSFLFALASIFFSSDFDSFPFLTI